MRILITGSRDWTDQDLIEAELSRVVRGAVLSGRTDVTLVSGACPTGADAICEDVAMKLGCKIERHPADWDKHGRRAGYVRNAEMVELGADVCLAFIKNGSAGATMTRRLASSAGILTLEWLV